MAAVSWCLAMPIAASPKPVSILGILARVCLVVFASPHRVVVGVGYPVQPVSSHRAASCHALHKPPVFVLTLLSRR